MRLLIRGLALLESNSYIGEQLLDLLTVNIEKELPNSLKAFRLASNLPPPDTAG